MSSSTRLGCIKETCHNKRSISFEWKIPKFLSLTDAGTSYYHSPYIIYQHTFWRFLMYPNGRFPAASNDLIVLYLGRHYYKTSRKPICFKLGIRKADGTEERVIRDIRLPEGVDDWRPIKFLTWSDLLQRKSELVPSGVLTIICTLGRNESSKVEDEISCSEVEEMSEEETSFHAKVQNITNIERELKHACLNKKVKILLYRLPQIEALINSNERGVKRPNIDTEEKRFSSQLSQTEDVTNGIERELKHARLEIKSVTTLGNHLRNFLLDGKKQDIAIKVQGQEFKAHKIMLQSRSPVFSRMLKLKKNNKDNCIKISDCSPNVFSDFLKYVYTGKLENLSFDNAIGLYSAGVKYCFLELKEMCYVFLKNSLSVKVITDVMTLAIKHNDDELLQCTVAFFSNHLEEIMISEEWKQFVLSDPIKANELCLKALKMSHGNIE